MGKLKEKIILENFWTSTKPINGLRHFVLVNETKEKGNITFLMVSVVDSEINIETTYEELKNSGKKENMIDKISQGKLNKFISDNTLLNQIWIMDTKKKVKDILTEIKEPKADHLVIKIMSEKINQKYTSKLSFEQKDIIRNYALNSDNPKYLKAYLTNLKNKTMNLVENYRKQTDNHVILSKIDKVYDKISELKVENIDDVEIKKFLTVSSLKKQILRSEND